MRLNARAVSAADAAKEASTLITSTLDNAKDEPVSATFLRPLVDVQADVERFRLQLLVADRAKTGIFCVMAVGSALPIPVVIIPPIPKGVSVAKVLSTQSNELVRFYRKAFDDHRVLGQESAPFHPEEAKGIFRILLEKFVKKRFSSPNVPPGNIGLPIAVTSKTRGARVHFTPEFMHVEDRVLGEPTSPVNGELIPGNYRLGLSVHGSRPRFDYQLVEIPPRRDVRLDP